METIEKDPLQETIENLLFAAQFYYEDITEWPFHNYQHMLETLKATTDIADECASNGLILNRRVLYAAAVFHDAGYHSEEALKFKCKEKYSAHLAAMVLPELDYSPEEIKHVQECIMATEYNIGDPKLEAKERLFWQHSDEAKALVRADLINMTWDYREAKQKMIDFWYESKYKDPKIVFTNWAPKAIKILRGYNSRYLALGPWDKIEGHESKFHVLVDGNIIRLEKDIPAIAAELELAA